MKKAKRILSVVLCLVMLLCAVPVMEVEAASVSISQSKITEYALEYWDNYNSDYSNYNSIGGDCCNFVSQCLHYAGLPMDDSWYWYSYSTRSGSWTVCTNLKNYLVNTLGCRFISSPSANQIDVGDVFYYNNGSHVGICSEVIDGQPWVCAHNNDRHTSNWRLGYSTYAVIKTSDLASQYANLGEQFYGVILNDACWKPISLNTSNNTITLESEKNVAYQKWRFTRQDDGAYVIESCENGKALEMTNGVREARTQLTAHDDWWGGYYQQWYLIPQGDGYIFQSKHFSSEEWVMDLKDSDGHDGTIIQNYKRNNSSDQIWSIYTGDEVQLKAPTLTVKAGSSTQKTVFTWNSIYGNRRYDVKIWKNKVDHSVDSYHTEWGATSGYSIQLPPGTYEAYVTASDHFQIFGSQDVKFTVTGNTPSNTPVNLGNDFYAVVLTYDAWIPIANDYINTHNVFLQKGEHQQNSAHQLWRFQRQSNGSYAISSAQDGRFLEMREGEHVENTPVAAMNATFWDGAYQKWWIYENNGGGYFIKSDHFTSQGWYMTLKNNQTAIGTQVTACSLNGTSGQVWGIYIDADTQLKAPTLTVTPGSAATNTTFSWPHVFGAKGFTIKVWKNAVNTSTNPDYSKTVTSTSGALILPAGSYEAIVQASNQYQSFNSNKVKFTVQQATYQINYSYNGGTGAPMSQTKIHGEDLVLTTVVPYRVGYVFQNWNTKLNGTGAVYAPGDTYKANEAATLYAAWKVCTHTWNNGVVTKAATCITTGTKDYTCSVCNATKTDSISINSNNHINTEDVAETASTCAVKGYTAGVYCNDCKKYISGHEAQPLAAHTLTTINKKDAGCTTTGYTGDQYCTVCKQTISTGSTINALGHTAPDGNGNCTRCGTHIKDVTPPQPQTNPNACKWCGGTHNGFIGAIVGFFHRILAAIFGARY